MHYTYFVSYSRRGKWTYAVCTSLAALRSNLEGAGVKAAAFRDKVYIRGPVGIEGEGGQRPKCDGRSSAWLYNPRIRKVWISKKVWVSVLSFVRSRQNMPTLYRLIQIAGAVASAIYPDAHPNGSI